MHRKGRHRKVRQRLFFVWKAPWADKKLVFFENLKRLDVQNDYKCKWPCRLSKSRASFLPASKSVLAGFKKPAKKPAAFQKAGCLWCCNFPALPNEFNRTSQSNRRLCPLLNPPRITVKAYFCEKLHMPKQPAKHDFGPKAGCLSLCNFSTLLTK